MATATLDDIMTTATPPASLISSSTTVSSLPNRERHGLHEALAARRACDELIVAKLDRLAPS
jgi:DNA invertase Pin-like site-specific DNA recombinase